MPSCSNDDDWNTGGYLSFSSDTLNFETVFSETGSPTMQLRIYNKGAKKLNIDNIELVNAAKSGFRMNLDGESGEKFGNVELLKKDSLFAFIEITPKSIPSGAPVVIRDSIRFDINGNTQYVQLEAIGQDVYVWKGNVINTDSHLSDDKPYLIYDSLVVAEDARLTIPQGVTFYFRRNSSLKIRGAVDAQGTIDKPIVMRGDRFGDVVNGVSYDNVSGQWQGIVFYDKSFDNSLNNVIAKNAVEGMVFKESSLTSLKARLINVVVQNTSENGVVATNCNIVAENCLFANSRGAALLVVGGKYAFTHCTIVNYYEWSSRRYNALGISNYWTVGATFPLEQCDIVNSIIYGSVSQEYNIDQAIGGAFNYKFVNCLIRDTGENISSQFINCIWNADPRFVNVNGNRDYNYNFELGLLSPAIDQADNSLSLPTDIKGQLRPNGLKSDIGCYEWY